jgi:hypothetical protein
MTEPVPGDLGFSYEFGIDIDLGYPAGPPDWNQIAFITDAGDTNEKATADTATYADRGAARNAITGETWGLSFTHQLQRNVDGTYVEVLAALVEASKFGKRNTGAKVRVRWYDTEGADYAYQGEAYVSRARSAQGNAEVGGFTFTLTGDGPAVEIVNPNLAAGAPTVTAATPSAAPQNAIVKVIGTRFTGATDVRFGATTAGTINVGWYIDDDRTIYARVPAGTAGPAAVTVINPTGTSNALSYTRGA